MAVISAKQNKYISFKKDGSPNSLGTVGFYVAEGVFSTPITIWDTQTKDSTLTNPVTLDSDGTKEVWFDVAVDIQEKDSSGNVVNQSFNIDPNITSVSNGNYSQVLNGSFEIGSTIPDSWTVSEESGGTIAISAASGFQSHGSNGLKFQGASSGAGTATSEFFPVNADGACEVNFIYKTANTDTTNSVKLYWYQYDDTASAVRTTDTAYSATSAGTGNSTTFVAKTTAVDVPSDAVKAKIELTGVSSSGTNKSGPTTFDNIEVINISTDRIIFDLNGNEILETEATASAVNHINIRNAATGLSPTIQSAGEADQGIDFENSEEEELLELEAVATAVNNIKITNAATTNRPIISTSGEADIGIDFQNDQGEELLELIPVATAVNNVRITNAVTTAAAIIDVSETNSDLDFPRNGTGEITVDSVPIYGMVLLDTPVLLETNTSGGSVSQTAIDITTARATGGTVVARKAIVQVTLYYKAGVSSTAHLRAGEGDITLTAVHNKAMGSSAGTNGTTSDGCEFTVNLASGEIFDYSISQTGTVDARTATFYLAGYYT